MMVRVGEFDARAQLCSKKWLHWEKKKVGSSTDHVSPLKSLTSSVIDSTELLPSPKPQQSFPLMSHWGNVAFSKIMPEIQIPAHPGLSNSVLLGK